MVADDFFTRSGEESSITLAGEGRVPVLRSQGEGSRLHHITSSLGLDRIERERARIVLVVWTEVVGAEWSVVVQGRRLLRYCLHRRSPIMLRTAPAPGSDLPLSGALETVT